MIDVSPARRTVFFTTKMTKYPSFNYRCLLNKARGSAARCVYQLDYQEAMQVAQHNGHKVRTQFEKFPQRLKPCIQSYPWHGVSSKWHLNFAQSNKKTTHTYIHDLLYKRDLLAKSLKRWFLSQKKNGGDLQWHRLISIKKVAPLFVPTL
jgi:hypothetical protein